MKSDISKEILEANLSLLEPLSLTETYKKVVRELQKLMESQHASIFLMENNTLKRVYTTIPKETRIKPRKAGFTQQAILERRPLIVRESELHKIHPEADVRVKTIAIMPLIYDDKAIGALTIQYHGGKHVDKKRLHVMQLFASVASFAIRNAQLMKNLKQTLAVRDLFISSASHEFKTPLTAISLYTELLQKASRKGKHPDSEWVNRLAEQVRRLNNMFEDFLTVEKMRMDELEYRLSMLRVEVLVKKAIENFYIRHRARTITYKNELRKTTNDRVKGDFDKLLQVLNNVLNNAAKFSHRSTSITVILAEGHSSHDIAVSITDSGIGIDKKDINKIFQKYYTTKTRNKEGMGIGMYLTKKIIEKHNGKIQVVSEKGRGTTVSIILPRHI